MIKKTLSHETDQSAVLRDELSINLRDMSIDGLSSDNKKNQKGQQLHSKITISKLSAKDEVKPILERNEQQRKPVTEN